MITDAMAAIGFIMLVLQPGTFAGSMCAVVIYAVGGGLLEVLISPIVEASPTATTFGIVINVLYFIYFQKRMRTRRTA